eukprot:scaffold16845_cov27-Tisochrysis_lutea.AAC.2
MGAGAYDARAYYLDVRQQPLAGANRVRHPSIGATRATSIVGSPNHSSRWQNIVEVHETAASRPNPGPAARLCERLRPRAPSRCAGRSLVCDGESDLEAPPRSTPGASQVTWPCADDAAPEWPSADLTSDVIGWVEGAGGGGGRRETLLTWRPSAESSNEVLGSSRTGTRLHRGEPPHDERGEHAKPRAPRGERRGPAPGTVPRLCDIRGDRFSGGPRPGSIEGAGESCRSKCAGRGGGGGTDSVS